MPTSTPAQTLLPIGTLAIRSRGPYDDDSLDHYLFKIVCYDNRLLEVGFSCHWGYGVTKMCWNKSTKTLEQVYVIASKNKMQMITIPELLTHSQEHFRQMGRVLSEQ